jgi:AcrR family transcriptional regulator
MGRRPRVTRETVLGTARQAFSERGYDGTTLADIGARLGVSPAALLRHAPSKQALFDACMDPLAVPGGGPLEFLRDVDPKTDPRKVLRRVAHAFVPFAEAKLKQDIVHFLHLREQNPAFRASGPRMTLAVLSQYLRGATRRGVLSVTDPEATAIMILGSLQSYAFLHVVLRVFDPPFPLERYVDNLVRVLTRGLARTEKARTQGRMPC